MRSDEHGSLVWKAVNGDFEDGIFTIDGKLNFCYTDVPFNVITWSHQMTMKTSTKERPPTKRPIDAQMRPPKHGTWQTYDVTDGLPAGVVCLLQDRHGYLWLGTNGGGLCRYDGAEFIIYTTADGLADNQISSICEDPHGRLWIGTGSITSKSGKGVSCFDGRDFTTYTIAHGLADNNVLAVCEDFQGRLWFATDGGASCFNGQRFVTYTTADGLADNRILSICTDHQGCLWFGTWHGVTCFDGQGFNSFTDERQANYIWAIREDCQGRLWFAPGWPEGRGIFCLDGDHFINYTTTNGLAHNNVAAIYQDGQGRLWFAFAWPDDGGISCFDERGFTTYTTDDGLLDNRVTDILQDREGNLWFAHPWSGLTRFDSETLQLLTTELVSDILLQDRGGHLWFGSGKDIYCLFEGQQRRQSFHAQVRSLLEDSRGNLWVGTVGDGLYCYDCPDAVWQGVDEAREHLFVSQSIGGEQRERFFTTVDGSGSSNVQFLLAGRDGTIWAGTAYPGYLCRRDGETWDTIPTPHHAVFRLLEDKQGRIWMGGWAGGGLSCYDGKEFITYAMADGLPNNHVGSIVEDDAGRLWIGTQQGLCCFDGKQFTTSGKAQGLTSLFHQWSTKDV
ncbi:hypothetical protein HYR99_06740, partial [Candidatus Poribacteria bacterium]|nr:hypothetical protein [Candidatus Poribacteria bacterium]